ncbi:MAG: hypothetical protein BKP49_01425 [Treponema sp. CETP13]|nr:MAG: hypothetical protein BKP49_01425 [Treponema sp. CETP13]
MKKQIKKNRSKYLTFFLVFSLFSSFIFAEKYKITSFEYNITGRTKEYPLNSKITIDTDTIFLSTEELNAYLESLKQEFLNQRVLESTKIEPQFENPQDITEPIQVHLLITIVDSWNFIAFPYPLYDSNDGFSAKLKAKDYNFFGSMSELEFELEYFTELPTYTDSNSQIIPLSFSDGNGISTNINFSYPFKISYFDVVWENTITLAYVFGEDSPYFVSQTGFDFQLPYTKFTLDFDIQETYTYNDYYSNYSDSSYINTNMIFSVPYYLYNYDVTGDIFLTPFTIIDFNTDFDIFTNTDSVLGMENPQLANPEFGGGIQLNNTNINWIHNFRKGFSQTTSFSIIKLIESDEIKQKIDFSATFFIPFTHFAINSQVTAFYHFLETDTLPVGSYMRGILDTEDYVTKAVILNLDIPISLFTTNWRKLGLPSITKYADFELQASPYIDVAINSSDTKYFFTTGLELIVFPLKMRSIQVRGSFGFDVTDPQNINHEIYAGLGLFY